MGSDSVPPKLSRMRVYTEVWSVHTCIPSLGLKDCDIHVLDVQLFISAVVCCRLSQDIQLFILAVYCRLSQDIQLFISAVCCGLSQDIQLFIVAVVCYRLSQNIQLFIFAVICCRLSQDIQLFISLLFALVYEDLNSCFK